MSRIDQVLPLKGERSVEIIESNLPDVMVKAFLDSLDDWAKEKFRHEPDTEKEHQYFALDNMGDRANKIVAYGAVYPRDKESREACLAVVVDPEWRGTGLGKKMYEFGAEVAKNNGKESFRAETDADNEAALAIMRSLDWELYGPIYIVKQFWPLGQVKGSGQ